MLDMAAQHAGMSANGGRGDRRDYVKLCYVAACARVCGCVRMTAIGLCYDVRRAAMRWLPSMGQCVAAANVSSYGGLCAMYVCLYVYVLVVSVG